MKQKTFLIAQPYLLSVGSVSVGNLIEIQKQFDEVDQKIEDYAMSNNLLIQETKLITIAGYNGGEATIGYSVLFVPKPSIATPTVSELLQS